MTMHWSPFEQISSFDIRIKWHIIMSVTHENRVEHSHRVRIFNEVFHQHLFTHFQHNITTKLDDWYSYEQYLPTVPLHWTNTYHLMAQFYHFIQFEIACIRFEKGEHLVMRHKWFAMFLERVFREAHRFNWRVCPWKRGNRNIQNAIVRSNRVGYRTSILCTCSYVSVIHFHRFQFGRCTPKCHQFALFARTMWRYTCNRSHVLLHTNHLGRRQSLQFSVVTFDNPTGRNNSNFWYMELTGTSTIGYTLLSSETK